MPSEHVIGHLGYIIQIVEKLLNEKYTNYALVGFTTTLMALILLLFAGVFTHPWMTVTSRLL